MRILDSCVCLLCCQYLVFSRVNPPELSEPCFIVIFITCWCRLIEPFQKGEITTFEAHIKEGLRKLADTRDSLLVFTGCVIHRPLLLSEVTLTRY